MPLSTRQGLIILLITFGINGCSINYPGGYGETVKSRLDKKLATPIEMPAEAPSITQRYLPVGVSSRSDHKGFDIRVASRTPIIASADGVVSRVALSVLYGNQLMLDHERTGAGYRIQTRYFHLKEEVVTKGERVRRGQLIGYSGATGLAGIIPHLHFEVHRLNEADVPVAIKVLDPQLFWVDGPGRVTCYDSTREFVSTPAGLTYPVPCRGIEWQP